MRQLALNALHRIGLDGQRLFTQRRNDRHDAERIKPLLKLNNCRFNKQLDFFSGFTAFL